MVDNKTLDGNVVNDGVRNIYVANVDINPRWLDVGMTVMAPSVTQESINKFWEKIQLLKVPPEYSKDQITKMLKEDKIRVFPHIALFSNDEYFGSSCVMGNVYSVQRFPIIQGNIGKQSLTETLVDFLEGKIRESGVLNFIVQYGDQPSYQNAIRALPQDRYRLIEFQTSN